MLQKSSDHQLRLGFDPMIYMVLYIPGFYHQQYVLLFETMMCKANGGFYAHYLMMMFMFILGEMIQAKDPTLQVGDS